MKKIILLTLILTTISCKEENKTQIASNESQVEYKNENNIYDELIGDYTKDLNGEVYMSIVKQNDEYFLKTRKNQNLRKLKEVETSEISKWFKDDNTSEYFVAGLKVGSAGIAKVKKGYEFKSSRIFKTDYVLLPFGKALYRK